MDKKEICHCFFYLNGKLYKMQREHVKIFVTIIFGLFLLFFLFVIEEKFIAESGYAKTDENSYTEKIEKIFETKEPAYQNVSVERIERQINLFFSYLDEQQYVKSYKFFSSSKEQFQQISEILVTNPPMVPRETDSLDKVLKNVFYFYRVLGKERVNLVKDILENESDIIELLMHTFYQWFATKNKNSKLTSAPPSIEQLYVYACFLLETLGGRNYLFRRNPKIRILTSYYCVLIIDQANIDGVNSNGVDIRPHIKLVLEDMSLQVDFYYKNQYLMLLDKLKKKYKLP